MRHARLAFAALPVLALVACGGPSANDKASAVTTALGWQISGGTLGECLDRAGYDVTPDFVKDSVQAALDEGWFRVGFISNSHDTVHVGVDVPDKRVVPYEASDASGLTSVGCGVFGEPYK